MKFMAILLGLMIGLGTGLSPALAITPEDQEEIRSELDRWRLFWGIPELTVMIAEDGGAPVMICSGADAGPGEDLWLGEISHSLTALGVLRLSGQGIVDTAAGYREYVPWIRVEPDSGRDRQLSVDHLLGHRSGLSFRTLPWPGEDQGPAASLVALRWGRFLADPGERFMPFEMNYGLLALMIQEVSHEEYGAWMDREVFSPLGMNNTTVMTGGGELDGHISLFGWPVPHRETLPPWRQYSAGIKASPTDVGRYLSALSGGEKISPEERSRLFSRPRGSRDGYGTGWYLEGARGTQAFQKGSFQGAWTGIRVEPEDSLAVLVSGPVNHILYSPVVYPLLMDSLMRQLEGKSVFPWYLGGIVWKLAAILPLLWLVRMVRVFLGVPERVREHRYSSRTPLILEMLLRLIPLPVILVAVPGFIRYGLGIPLSAGALWAAAPDLWATGLLVILMNLLVSGRILIRLLDRPARVYRI